MESVLLSEAALELHAQASSAPSPSPPAPLVLDPAAGAHGASPAGHAAWHGLQAAQRQGGLGRPGLGTSSQEGLHRQPEPPARLLDPSCPKPSDHLWAPAPQPAGPNGQAAPEPPQLWTMDPQQAKSAQHTHARAGGEREEGAAADAATAERAHAGEAASEEAGGCGIPEPVAVAQPQGSRPEAPSVAARLAGLAAASPAGGAPPAQDLQWAASQVGCTVACGHGQTMLQQLRQACTPSVIAARAVDRKLPGKLSLATDGPCRPCRRPV